MKTAREYRLEQGWSLDRMCLELNKSKRPEESPFFAKRLENMEAGLATVHGFERRALMVLTDDECDRYN